MINLDYDAALKFLEAAADEKGDDYVYPFAGGRCVYVKDDAPACLVGNALHRAGVDLDTLHDVGDFDAGVSAWSLMRTLKEEGLVDSTSEARWLLEGAQGLQDCGNTWRESIEGGKQYTKRQIDANK